MFCDPLYDNAVFPTLELLEKHYCNIETINNDLKIELINPLTPAGSPLTSKIVWCETE